MFSSINKKKILFVVPNSVVVTKPYFFRVEIKETGISTTPNLSLNLKLPVQIT